MHSRTSSIIKIRVHEMLNLKKGFENSSEIDSSFIAFNELNYLIYHNENNNKRKRKHGIIKNKKIKYSFHNSSLSFHS